MPLTALMFVVLFVSFALMFALVKFTEVIIDRAETAAADGDGAATLREAETETQAG